MDLLVHLTNENAFMAREMGHPPRQVLNDEDCKQLKIHNINQLARVFEALCAFPHQSDRIDILKGAIEAAENTIAVADAHSSKATIESLRKYAAVLGEWRVQLTDLSEVA